MEETDLKPGAMVTFAVISNETRKKGRCNLTLKQIARLVHVNPLSVKHYLRELREAGLISGESQNYTVTEETGRDQNDRLSETGRDQNDRLSETGRDQNYHSGDKNYPSGDKNYRLRAPGHKYNYYYYAKEKKQKKQRKRVSGSPTGEPDHTPSPSGSQRKKTAVKCFGLMYDVAEEACQRCKLAEDCEHVTEVDEA